MTEDRKSWPLKSNQTANISPGVDGKSNTVHPWVSPPAVAHLAATLDAGNHAS